MTARRGNPSSRMALVRARLALPTIRRAVGHSEGQHSSMFTGHGIDFEDQVEYRPGDDVSSIDWKSSARAGHPIIRRFERESDVFTQLVLDMGVEMLATAPSGERKCDIGIWAADVLAYLGSSGATVSASCAATLTQPGNPSPPRPRSPRIPPQQGSRRLRRSRGTRRCERTA